MLEAKQPETEEPEPKKGSMMINISRPIRDQNGQVWHRKRKWVELTPAICQVVDCGFDFLKENNLPKWDELSKGEQDLVLRGMATHALTHEHERSRMVSIGEYEEIQKQGWPPPQASRIPAVLKTK